MVRLYLSFVDGRSYESGEIVCLWCLFKESLDMEADGVGVDQELIIFIHDL